MISQRFSKKTYLDCILIIIVLLGLMIPSLTQAKAYEIKNVKVNRVIDGDTFVITLPDLGNQTIRIWGVDSPEKRQKFGPQAAEFLASLIWDKPLTLLVKNKDQYGRSIAQVFHEGVDIGLVMTRYGFAWHYVAVTKDKKLAQAQVEAKKQRLGIWSDVNPTPPWVFRKAKIQ